MRINELKKRSVETVPEYVNRGGKIQRLPARWSEDSRLLVNSGNRIMYKPSWYSFGRGLIQWVGDFEI